MNDAVANFEYSIKLNARAKHLRIKISNLGNVSVVRPFGTSENDVHRFVEKNTDWINETLGKLNDERLSHPDLGLQAPKNIRLKALSKNYLVHYFPKQKKSMVQEKESTLSVFSSSDAESIALLKAWIQKKAKQYLTRWLHDIASQHHIAFNRLTIRGQKTRWGSCSSQKNINLNRNLLFVERELVSYLMVHELSHIFHLDHSYAFWAKVAEYAPDYKALDQRLNKSHKIIPLWMYL